MCNFSVPQRCSCPSNQRQLNIESFILFKIFFWCTWFLKVFIEFVRILLRFMSWCFGHEAWKILAPRRGIEPVPPALEGEVLTTWPPGKLPEGIFKEILNPVSGTKVSPGHTLWGSHSPLISPERLGVRSISHLERWMTISSLNSCLEKTFNNINFYSGRS